MNFSYYHTIYVNYFKIRKTFILSKPPCWCYTCSNPAHINIIACGFDPQMGQTNDVKISILCFSAQIISEQEQIVDDSEAV